MAMTPSSTASRRRALRAARAQRNARRREAVLEGVLAIQEGLNPRLIDQKLRGLLGLEGPAPRNGLSGRAA